MCRRANAEDLVVGIDIGGTKLEGAAFRGGQQTGGECSSRDTQP